MSYTAPTDEEIGENVRTYRRAAGLSQTALAERLSEVGLPMSQQTVQKIESGARALKLTEGTVIGRALNIRPEWLLARQESDGAWEAFELAQALGHSHEELARATFQFRDNVEALRQHLSAFDLSDDEIADTVQPRRLAMLQLPVSEVVEAILDPEKGQSLGLVTFKSRAADDDGE